MPAKDWLALPSFLGLCLLVGLIGGWLTQLGVRDWYPTLAKPFFTPPNWLFAPAWTILYIAMGVAAWLVWRRAGWSRPLLFWSVQLALNLVWSGLFFGLRQPGLAFAEILLLWLAIAATMIAFRPVSGTASALFVPYLAWVSYAALLNGSIWLMNR